MALWGTLSINRDDASDFRTAFVQGSNPEVGIVFESMWAVGGLYEGIQAPAAAAMRVRAGGNVADNQAGIGAHQVTIIGLLDDGLEDTDAIFTHATDGTLVGDPGSVLFSRTNSMFIGDGETGANFSSNVGMLVVENTTGQRFGAMTAARSTSQVAWYTIPKGFEGVVNHVTLTTDGKAVDAILCHKNNQEPTFSASALNPSPVRTMDNWDGVTGIERDYPAGLADRSDNPLQPLTDVFFSCLATGPVARVTGSFSLIMRRIPG